MISFSPFPFLTKRDFFGWKAFFDRINHIHTLLAIKIFVWYIYTLLVRLSDLSWNHNTRPACFFYLLISNIDFILVSAHSLTLNL